MREIVHIQIGECGNLIGNEFWTQICKEHMIAHNGTFDENKENGLSIIHQINTYYHNDNMRYIPRACLIDLDPSSLDTIKASSTGSLFKPDNFYAGSEGCDGNWFKGHYTQGAESAQEIMNIIRKESECCDYMQAFQLTHSISGGTSGGLGSLILRKLKDNYSDKMSATFSVFPSTKVSDSPLDTFNAIISINTLIEKSDLTYTIDNNALYNMTQNILKQKQPTYSHMNWLVSLMMSGVTAPFRFTGNENNYINTMRKMCINLVPFPRLHFLVCSQSPLYNKEQKSEPKLNVEQITNEIWSSTNSFADVKLEDGKYLTSMCCFRGSEAYSYALNMDSIQYYSRDIDNVFFMNGFLRNNNIYKYIPSSIINLCGTYIPSNVVVKQEEYIQSMYEYEHHVYKMKNKKLDEYAIVDWIPQNVLSICINNIELNGTMIANTSSVRGVLQRIISQFAELCTSKEIVQTQQNLGSEFQESEKNVNDLILEYQDQQDAYLG